MNVGRFWGGLGGFILGGLTSGGAMVPFGFWGILLGPAVGYGFYRLVTESKAEKAAAGGAA